MTAKDILSYGKRIEDCHPLVTVESDMPVLEIIPRLLDTPMREVGVTDAGRPMGVIDQTSLLEGIGSMIATRDDCSVITVDCPAEDYSASLLAQAVEDSDAHLVDLLSVPGEDGRIQVTLRVRHSDPSAAVRSLERYDFHVLDAHSAGSDNLEAQIAADRLLSLQVLMNV